MHKIKNTWAAFLAIPGKTKISAIVAAVVVLAILAYAFG